MFLAATLHGLATERPESPPQRRVVEPVRLGRIANVVCRLRSLRQLPAQPFNYLAALASVRPDCRRGPVTATSTDIATGSAAQRTIGVPFGPNGSIV